ncbi:MAG: ABC transporter substrate-binding protein [Rhodospirillales bacterium]|nr:MAG: ABC transporter substrate-binding protein [Rhodospirillales bacterium]
MVFQHASMGLPFMGRPVLFGLTGLFLLCLVLSPAALAQAPVPSLRISTENSEDHVQTRAVARFIGQLKQRAGDSLAVEFYPEARMFRDRDVIRALEQGRVEMALPGIWQFDRFVPDVGLYFLPLLYGQDDAVIDRLRDGEIGSEINHRLESALGVKVLGRWIDLGPAQLFTTRKRVRQIKDLEGLVIRTPGGEASAMRLSIQGARPQAVPWPDLPSALSGGSLDGMVTTFETAVSARLWEHGIGYAYEDRAYFAQYIPLVSAAFWNRLAPQHKQAIHDAWEATVGPSRVSAAQAQAVARSVLIANGVRITTPSPKEREQARNRLLLRQPEMIKALGIDTGLAERAAQDSGIKP